MRLIAKGREPSELVTYRQQPGAEYDGAGFNEVKQSVRDALIRDQMSLCCYCEARVDATADRMNIEHWEPQSLASARQLDWKNLLAACKGSPGTGAKGKHCDHQKDNDRITLDPQRDLHVRTLSFGADGTLRSSDDTLQADIDTRLHLNLPQLRALRKGAVDALVSYFRRRHPGEFPVHALRRELERHTHPDASGSLPRYSSAVAFWLRRRLGEPR